MNRILFVGAKVNGFREVLSRTDNRELSQNYKRKLNKKKGNVYEKKTYFL